MKTIIYVHGANSSPLSFNFIAHTLPAHIDRRFQYYPEESIEIICQRLITEIEACKKKVTLIGHSLGGIIALLASFAIPEKIDMVVTLSAPFGGIKHASALKMFFPRYLLLQQLDPSGRVMRTVAGYKAPAVPTYTIISTEGGTPLILEPNDGVVEIASQSALKGAFVSLLPVNHFEVLLCKNVVFHIKSFIWDNATMLKDIGIIK